MTTTRIVVKSYSGYKGEERPQSFAVEGHSVQVKEITDRWYDPDANYYKVVGDDDSTYLLRNDLNEEEWELVSPKEKGDE